MNATTRTSPAGTTPAAKLAPQTVVPQVLEASWKPQPPPPRGRTTKSPRKPQRASPRPHEAKPAPLPALLQQHQHWVKRTVAGGRFAGDSFRGALPASLVPAGGRGTHRRSLSGPERLAPHADSTAGGGHDRGGGQSQPRPRKRVVHKPFSFRNDPECVQCVGGRDCCLCC